MKTAKSDHEDKADIRELLNRYTFIIDRGKTDQLRSIFADDGRFRIVDLPSGESNFSIDEFASFLTDTLNGSEFMQHLMTNTVVSVDGDHAIAESYLSVLYGLKPGVQTQAFGLFDEPTDLHLGGEYIDKLARTADGWRIQERTARFFYQRTITR